jgi:hypothetical protein
MLINANYGLGEVSIKQAQSIILGDLNTGHKTMEAVQPTNHRRTFLISARILGIQMVAYQWLRYVSLCQL